MLKDEWGRMQIPRDMFQIGDLVVIRPGVDERPGFEGLQRPKYGRYSVSHTFLYLGWYEWESTSWTGSWIATSHQMWNFREERVDTVSQLPAGCVVELIAPISGAIG